MKNFKKIGRIYEAYTPGEMMPPELLSMTVGDLLDKMQSLDTSSSQDFENMESVLIKVKDSILAGTGYVAPSSTVPTGSAMEPTVATASEISPEDQEANMMAAAADTMPEVDFTAADQTTDGDLENFSF